MNQTPTAPIGLWRRVSWIQERFSGSMVTPCLWALSLGCVVLAAPARNLVSQEAVVTKLTRSPDCDCRIELTKVISLSDSMHPGLFAYSPLVMRDSRGFWYATSSAHGLKQVGVFDRDGRLTRVIGRLGEGPGEFTHINHIVVDSEDSLYVYDHSQLRRTVYDPDHEFIRTEPIPAYMRQVVPLSSGHMIVNSTIATRDRDGWPLHLVGAGGGVLQSFGTETPSHRPGSASLELRSIAIDVGGELWIAPQNAYELTTYSWVAGQFEATDKLYRRQVTWFQPWTELSQGEPDPILRQMAFFPEDSGLLWVLIDVADSEWTPAREPKRPVRSTKALIDSLYDSIVEVVDVEEGVVLASQRFEYTLSELTFQGLIPMLRIDESNTVWMDIFTPILHRR